MLHDTATLRTLAAIHAAAAAREAIAIGRYLAARTPARAAAMADAADRTLHAAIAYQRAISA